MSTWQQRERAREILSREVGYVRKPHADRLRVALAFPNTYFVGMSNLGFQTVYRLFNAGPTSCANGCFCRPSRSSRLDGSSRASLLTLESQTPVGDFDVFAFSVSFEWDYTNVLTMLRLAGFRSTRRSATERHPLIVIGGAVTFVNPEPLALFADIIAAGEGEIADSRAGRGDVAKRRAAADCCGAWHRERGFYMPSFYDVSTAPMARIVRYRAERSRAPVPPVRKAARESAPNGGSASDVDLHARHGVRIAIPDRSRARLRESVPLLLGRLQLSAGPRIPCRKDPRARAEARAHSAASGWCRSRCAIIRTSSEILRRLAEMGYSISPASLRLDDLTPTIVRLLRASGERTMTIAPETGSDRLRRVINKTVTNEEILDRAELIFANGIENLKLYYMIGLPTETDEDLVAIRDLTAADARRMMRYARARGQDRPHRRQRQPPDPQAGHGLSVAAHGGPLGDRPKGQAPA